MATLEEWAEEHRRRAQVEQVMESMRRLWTISGMGKTLLMSGPMYERIVVGVDLGKDSHSVTKFTLAGEREQQQEQKQDGSEGAAEVHDAKPG